MMNELDNTVDHAKFRGPELRWFLWAGMGIVIIVVVAGVVFFLPNTSSEEQNLGAPTATPIHEHTVDHGKIGLEDVPYALAVPTVQMLLTEDPAGGYNIHLTTTNFLFAPEHVNEDHIHGEGHAHLYVDGVKVARIYSSWYHLSSLPKGEHTIKAVLNTNDHRSYAYEGREISDVATLIVE